MLIKPTQTLIQTVASQAYVTELSAILHEDKAKFYSNSADAPLSEIEVVLGWSLPDELVARMPALQWIHATGAGVDQFTLNPNIPSNIVITRGGAESYDRRVAQYVLAHVLATCDNVREYAFQQMRREWNRLQANDVRRLKVGVLGHGCVGQAVARMLTLNGAEVRAFRRNVALGSENYPVCSIQELTVHIRSFDWLVVALPLTEATKGLVGKALLDEMKEGASVINVARASIFVELDLLTALHSGRIGRAILDVFEEEPLPSASQLWNHSRVVVTPHVAGTTDIPISAREFARNLLRYRANQDLLNSVDRMRQY